MKENKKCGICGTELPEKASLCFNCGANQEDPEQGNINFADTTETIQEDNKEPEITKEKRKLSEVIMSFIKHNISILIGVPLCLFSGGLYWETLFIVLTVYFIMRKVFKMHGFEFYIVFLSILFNLCHIILGLIPLVKEGLFGSLGLLGELELFIDLIFDLPICIVMLVAACLFYAKKSNLWLIILMFFENSYVIMAVLHLYINIFDFDIYTIMGMVLYVIMKAAVIILGIIYIFVIDPKRKKEIPLENTQQSTN